MNSKGREVLLRAALTGQAQAFGVMRELRPDGSVALCAMGVLYDELRAAGIPVRDERVTIHPFGMGFLGQSLGRTPRCPECRRHFDQWMNEAALVHHLNDDHRLDFIGIANKLPVTDQVAR
jgi:hypothetical protein